jgi:hypothetical protein
MRCFLSIMKMWVVASEAGCEGISDEAVAAA